jgi:hypothetical protein
MVTMPTTIPKSIGPFRLIFFLVTLLIAGANRYFVGGTVLQRPSLTMLNGVIVGGFGGHCDLFNYTGMLVAVSITPGVGVTSIYAMEGGPAAQPEVDNIFTQQGGKAGIWQGGMGIASDNSRIFLATGKFSLLAPSHHSKLKHDYH